MAKSETFEKHAERYDLWFERHPHAFRAELEAVRPLVPSGATGLEVGVGTGRFALPLGITNGLEPAAAMARRAAERGIRVVRGAAENLPYRNETFDFVLLVTTICFVDDAARTFRESRRVLRPGGAVIVGFVDRESAIGKRYLETKDESVFYRDARFFSVEEITDLLRENGFGRFRFRQTLFRRLNEIDGPEPTKEGVGEGSFVVVAAARE